MVSLKIFPASYGDCFLIKIKTEVSHINILIDGGLKNTYKNSLKCALIELGKCGEKLDLVINTHIDSDHIGGLISFLNDNIKNNFIQIGDIWFNGLEQVVLNYPKIDSSIPNNDEKIINEFLKKGYEDDFQEQEEISFKDNISFSSLIISGKYNHNKINNSQAITDSLNKINLTSDVSIKILSPNKEDLLKLEKSWFEELNTYNYRFTISKNEKLASSYEYLISRFKNICPQFKTKISSLNDINTFLNGLNEEDTSVVNGSSIAFVLEVKDQKFLFLGDSIIKNHDCNIIKNLKTEYKENLNFECVKLPHHGSQCNITEEFINLINSKEYIISTNSLKYNHPDLNVLAYLVTQPYKKKFIFNYPIKQANFLKEVDWIKIYDYEIITGNENEILERRY